MSGNLVVLNELISQHNVDVDAQMQINMYGFGVEQGVTALTVSAGLCPKGNAYEVVAALIAAGANPNAANKRGSTSLMSAAMYQNQNPSSLSEAYPS